MRAARDARADHADEYVGNADEYVGNADEYVGNADECARDAYACHADEYTSSGCHLNGTLEDLRCTPGSLNPAVNAASFIKSSVSAAFPAQMATSSLSESL